MAIKFENVEEIKTHEAGEYLMKITKAEEKTFKSGNSGYVVDFKSEDGLEIRFTNFVAFGKGANNLANLLYALGYIEGTSLTDKQNAKVPEAEDLVGLKLYVDTEKDEDGRYLKAKFCGYRKYENATKPAKKAEPVEDPF